MWLIQKSLWLAFIFFFLWWAKKIADWYKNIRDFFASLCGCLRTFVVPLGMFVVCIVAFVVYQIISFMNIKLLLLERKRCVLAQKIFVVDLPWSWIVQKYTLQLSFRLLLLNRNMVVFIHWYILSLSIRLEGAIYM